MIRTYSDPLIAVEVESHLLSNGIRHTTVTAESDTSTGKPKEFKVNFYGQIAEDALKSIVRGCKFTYRGHLSIEDGQAILVAKAFATIV